MRRSDLLTGILAPALLLCTGLAGCKPSEKSYKEAYETAVAAQRASTEGVLDAETEARLQVGGRPELVMTEGGDTLVCHSMWARPQGPMASMAPYYIIVGSFKQVFNAREMSERLRGLGYAGATLLTTADKDYLVSASEAATGAEALENLKKVKGEESLRLKNPYPWVLRTPKR